MKRALVFTFFFLLAAICLLAAGRGWSGQIVGDPIRGGLIYDDWLVLSQRLPEGDQPLWKNQETNRRSGAATWRCVECHGWDYKGAAGVYGQYSEHYTGFRGVQGAVGASHAQVMAWLDGTRNPAHDFAFYTGEAVMQDVAAFLRTQIVDTDLLIDPATGLSLGDAENGRALYAETCQACHGAQGEQINLGAESAPLYLADIAVADPWQTVHRIRFGVPARNMPAAEALGWSLGRVADVLAYIQTLQRGNPSLTPFSGSRPIPIESQGHIEPLIWGAAAIFAVILASLLYDFRRQGRLLLPKPRRNQK